MKSRFPTTPLFMVALVTTPALAQQAQAPAAQTPAAPAAPAAQAPAAPDTAPAAAPAKSDATDEQLAIQRADIDEQDARIADLETKLKALSTQLAKEQPAATSIAAGTGKPGDKPKAPEAKPADDETAIKVSAYVQAQYEHHQDSEDQLAPGGAPLNQDRFLVRRARVALRGNWKYSSVFVELDGNNVRGPSFGLQHAEASLLYRGERSYDEAPLVVFTAGLFDVPFGSELTTSSKKRWFMERSTISRAFFPAEPDLGAKLSGKLGFLTYSAAVINGEPLGERNGFTLQDPNKDKDYVGRIGTEAKLSDEYTLEGGVSVLNGHGFHAGTEATKNAVTWVDQNEDGAITDGELISTPGVSAVPSESFERWAVNADLSLRFTDSLGNGQLFGELTLGSNMDRGLFVADPVAAGGTDSREHGFNLAVVHDVYSNFFIGFRYDTYNPSSDFLDKRKGKLVPTTQTVTTYSPLVGFQLPNHARLSAQYDFVDDSMGRDERGVPTDRENNAWTIRLQGEL